MHHWVLVGFIHAEHLVKGGAGAAKPQVSWRMHLSSFLLVSRDAANISFPYSHLQTAVIHSGLILTLPFRRAAPSAEFSVDRTRHIMSFLTMLGPSPDWNVGLSAEDLCTKECGWAQRVVQDMIPWDAGTDSGVTYEVSNIQTF